MKMGKKKKKIHAKETQGNFGDKINTSYFETTRQSPEKSFRSSEKVEVEKKALNTSLCSFSRLFFGEKNKFMVNHAEIVLDEEENYIKLFCKIIQGIGQSFSYETTEKTNYVSFVDLFGINFAVFFSFFSYSEILQSHF